MRHSNIPPHHGAFSTLKHHLVPALAKCSWTSLLVTRASIILAAALKVFPLSELILIGMHHLAEKRLKLLRNATAVKSGTTSKCTACATHVQTEPYLLVLSRSNLLDKDWACKIHTCVSKWWCLLHSKWWKWRWWWARIRLAFIPVAGGALVDDLPYKGSALDNPASST